MKIIGAVRNIFFAIGQRIRKMLPNPKDTGESKNFKTTLYLLIACMLFMVLVAVIAFLAYVQPLDETVIPNLVGEDFRDAIIILQNKKLIPQFDFQFTNIPEDKDKIMKQDPKAREKVRIGSRVTLQVSKGMTLDQLGNYINKNLAEVETVIESSFNKEKELILIKKPINYISHKSPAGTIIAQNPAPGTPLGDKTLFLELTVSKGQVQTEFTVGEYAGKDFYTVIGELQNTNILLVFVVATNPGAGKPGSVISQNIEPGSTVEAGAILILEMIKPTDVPEGKVFGLYTYNIPEVASPVLIKIEAELLGRRTTLLSQERYGGKLALPYILDRETEIIITIAGEEKQPEKVSAY